MICFLIFDPKAYSKYLSLRLSTWTLPMHKTVLGEMSSTVVHQVQLCGGYGTGRTDRVQPSAHLEDERMAGEANRKLGCCPTKARAGEMVELAAWTPRGRNGAGIGSYAVSLENLHSRAWRMKSLPQVKTVVLAACLGMVLAYFHINPSTTTTAHL